MAHPLLERFPKLRRITDAPPVHRAILVRRLLPVVAERRAFVVAELRGGLGVYRLAGGPARLAVRHQTPDLEIVDEILRLSHYTPPAPAAAALSRAAALRPLRVLDLGANIGLFGIDVLRRYPLTHLVSYEADPANFTVLSRCREANAGARWEVHEQCVTTSPGTVRFAAGHFAHSRIGSSGVAVTGVDILPELSAFDFVKVDIEGGEWPVIGDPRWPAAMSAASAVVMEWHERGSSAQNPRLAALEAVRKAGFEAIDDGPGYDHGLIWGWRT